MRSNPLIVAIAAAISLSLTFYSQASSMDDPGFVINRMVMCERISEREPVAVGDTFSAETEKVFCFLEAGEIEDDTRVSFIWYLEDKEMARVSLPLARGRRWRTYTSKELGGLKGDWKVELQESSGIVLNSVSFRVQ